ncbi:MAG TPA: S8 family serine peptidase, partial [Kofleriaceae bacterium]|nr:S8 family serine peptidase [Kofleriaceae bacterium]
MAPIDASSPTAHDKAPDSLWKVLGDGQPHSFIVALDDTDGKPAWTERKKRMVDEAPATELGLDREWEHLPLMLVHASTSEAAAALFDHDEVIAAFEPEAFQMSDAESFPLIDQPAAIAAGHAGAGTSVAILDTGTDYTRAAFGSCTAPGVPSSCKVSVAMDFATDDHALDANGHGTNVAGITLGVAPDTRILALDVFAGDSAWNTDIISAINWTIANQATYHIAALNMSLGGGSSTTPCATDPLAIAVGSARSAGIAPVIAAGNNGFTNALSSPGCAPAAISVGAVYDANVGGLKYASCTDATTAADKITCFSNSASFLTVLAPGAMITAANITMAGTSQASPHVAGAMAILRGTFPDETIDRLVGRLTATGKPIKDARNGVTKPRIDIEAAIVLPPPDVTPPTGSLSINGGAATTKSASVTLAITSADAATMCISNTTACTTFSAFAATKAWTLATGAGSKTVTVVLRDAAGNTTTADTSPKATIVVDATAPTNGTVTATAGSAQVHLTWTGFADTGSGIASYRVVGGTTAPSSCTGTALWIGTDHGFAHTGLVNGTHYSYRVCAVDAAGNMS